MSKRIIPILFIVIIGTIPLIDLFNPGLPLTHDGKDHLARIANFYTALSDGQLIPRWGGNLNWGYGHPVLMFLYPMSSYIASIFHFLGSSYIDSLKLVFGFTFILSGVGMYMWIRHLLGVYAGILAAILYMYAPYRFINLYVRGALGEHVAFAFIPFVLLFATRLFTNKIKSGRVDIINFTGLGIFTAFLILSHNALSILFLIFTISYLIVLASIYKNWKRLLVSVIGVFYGFLLSAFFWIPAYIEGKYTLRDIVTGPDSVSGVVSYTTRFVDNPLNFFLPSWSYGITGQFSVQIGIVHILFIILSAFVVFNFRKIKSLNKKIYLLTLFFFFVSIFMMIEESNFVWSNIPILQKFQFPWRFLSLSVLTASLLGAFTLAKVKERRIAKLIISLVIVLLFVFYSSYWRSNGYINLSDSKLNSVYYGTTDTGESSPKWTTRFMLKEPSSHIEIVSGSAIIEEIIRSSNRHEYIIDAKTKVRIKENTLYFPGWKVIVNGRELDIDTEVEFQDRNYHGVMTFWVDPGINKVSLIFEDNKLRFLSSVISLVALIGIFILLFRAFVMTKFTAK